MMMRWTVLLLGATLSLAFQPPRSTRSISISSSTTLFANRPSRPRVKTPTRSSNRPSFNEQRDQREQQQQQQQQQRSGPSDPFGDYDDDDDSYSTTTTTNTGGGDYDNDNWGGSNLKEPVDFDSDIPKSHFYSKKDLTDPSFSNNKSKLFPLLCQGAKIERPSRIQSLAWPVLLDGKNAIVADQTGSGKTLAYLIPLLQRALEGIARDDNRTNGAPRLLVLSPTAELADQIRAVCEKLAANIPFKTMVITANGMYSTSIRDQIRLLQRQPVDVIISTPGRIATILRTKNSGLDLTNLQAIVLDEVDILLVDDTFGPQLRTIGVAAPKTQFVFCTATLPDEVVETVEREFPGTVMVKGPGLHRLAPTVSEHLIDVSVPSAYNRDEKLCLDIKAKQLFKALRQTRCRRTLVFCNTVESCRTVENLLNRKDRKGRIYEVAAYHNAMTPEARNHAIRIFAHGRQNDDNTDYILVCTDRAARGVDFDAKTVDHVVLFDFPKDPAEYVRRVGRTARAGRTGTSTVFAYGWQLPVARKIMGSKLTSFTVAIDDSTGGEDEEYKGGVQGRKTKGERDRMIKGNIEQGKLWKSRGEKHEGSQQI